MLIVGPYFYFREDEVAYSDIPEPTPKEDAVKIKYMAPARVEAPVEKPEPLVEVKTPEEYDSETSSDDEQVSRGPAIEEEGSSDPHYGDLEEAWNHELKALLNRLEPDEGEEIHKAYVMEKESFQAEMDALNNEKTQKTSEEAISEIDQLIATLDQKHQERLKEILGAHYEAVRDHYDQYMEASAVQY